MLNRAKMKVQEFLSLTSIFFLVNLNMPSVFAQTFDSITIPSDEPIWVYVIIGFVLATLACSAALPLAAMRQWSGGWKACAISPLIALAIWVGLIITANN